jgi:hypothetical protein
VSCGNPRRLGLRSLQHLNQGTQPTRGFQQARLRPILPQMEPQQRLFLALIWTAETTCGQDSRRFGRHYFQAPAAAAVAVPSAHSILARSLVCRSWGAPTAKKPGCSPSVQGGCGTIRVFQALCVGSGTKRRSVEPVSRIWERRQFRAQFGYRLISAPPGHSIRLTNGRHGPCFPENAGRCALQMLIWSAPSSRCVVLREEWLGVVAGEIQCLLSLSVWAVWLA